MPAPHEKSQNGCWTCRLRKKKCDERLQNCQACEIRGITCHGYGPKPGWMDGGAREKHVLTELQRTVKENLKRKRSYHPISPPQGLVAASGAVSISATESHKPIVANIPPTTTSPSSNYQANTYDFPFITYSSIVSAYDDLLLFPISPPNENGLPGYPQYIYENVAEEFNSTLLANFLDRVFPLQYSCYIHPVPELGRGWLLALLTRTKPLYHTSLALSALFMYSTLLKTGRVKCIQGYWGEMKRHHTLALRELRGHIAGLSNGDSTTLKQTIEAVACVIQLISFELLRGGTDSWQIHLRAASTLLPALAQHIASSGLAISGRLSLAEYEIALNNAPPDFPPHPDDIACDFLINSLIWYDIIACASTRHKPCLETSYGYIINSELSNIMGCESWVMILIYRISELQRWKMEQDPCFLDVDYLVARGSELERLLQEGLMSKDKATDQPLLRPKPAVDQKLQEPKTNKTIHLVTRTFALSALTYLHTVVSGPYPNDPKIKESVERTIECLQHLPDPKLIRNLGWPFCITACLATGSSNDTIPNEVDGGIGSFFAELIKKENVGELSGNVAKWWEVATECWRLRGQGQDVDWVDAMTSLGFQVLLV